MNESYQAIDTQQLLEESERFFDRTSTDYDPSSGADLLQKAAHQGSLTALEKIADCFYYGIGRPENDEVARNLYEQVYAATESNQSACQLGKIYGFGWGISPDFEKAKDFLVKAWKNECFAAAGILGDICLHIAEQTNDIERMTEGMRWVQRGVLRGDEYSTYRMAICYAMSLYGIQENKKRAYDLLMRVCDYPRALAYLVSSNGLGISDDVTYAELIEKATALAEAKGEASLYRALGRAYEGETRLKQSYEQSLDWYKKAWELGDKDAAFNIGVNYAHGWCGYPTDYVEAEAWLLKSAEQGSEAAMASLGDLYKTSAHNSYPADMNGLRAAFEWYEKAYESSGKTWDAFNAGEIGVELEDPSLYPRVVRCLKIAAENDIQWAYLPLARLSIEGGPDVFDPSLAWETLKKANLNTDSQIEQGKIDYLTGCLYEMGAGVEANAEKAVSSYLSASAKGNAQAKEALTRFKKTAFGWKICK